MGMYCSIKAVDANAVGARAAPLSLEKAWHGLHYLLTGSAAEGDWPLAFLLQGGEEVGDDDGYGPPRLFSPEEVREIDAALTAISDDVLWSRFDPEQMSAEGVYPDCWDESEDELREEYLGYFHEMKTVIKNASTKGKSLLISLT